MADFSERERDAINNITQEIGHSGWCIFMKSAGRGGSCRCKLQHRAELSYLAATQGALQELAWAITPTPNHLGIRANPAVTADDLVEASARMKEIADERRVR